MPVWLNAPPVLLCAPLVLCVVVATLMFLPALAKSASLAMTCPPWLLMSSLAFKPTTPPWIWFKLLMLLAVKLTTWRPAIKPALLRLPVRLRLTLLPLRSAPVGKRSPCLTTA